MPRIIESAGCPYCGCSCDDLKITVSDDGKTVLDVENACSIGYEIFRAGGHGGRVLRPRLRQPDGTMQEISYPEAFDYAARHLIAAKKPLCYGFGSTNCEAQAAAARMMDLAGGVLDNCATICHGPSLLAIFDNGYPSCTLGEVKNRADVVVYWGSNPIHAHPRHMSRYSTFPGGFFTGHGQRERTVIVVDPRHTDTANNADFFLKVQQGHDYELFNALRMVVQGNGADLPDMVAGIRKQEILTVGEILMKARFGTIFFGMGLTHTDGRNHNVDIAISLVRDLNTGAKWSIMAMRGHYNIAGSGIVWTWMFGFPYCLDLTKREYAHMNPGETSSVDLAIRDETDLFINIGTDAAAHFPIEAVKHLKRHPWITIDPRMTMATELADLHIPSGICGLDCGGTVYRMDNVPIRFKKVIEPPDGVMDDETILNRIADRMEELMREGGTDA